MKQLRDLFLIETCRDPECDSLANTKSCRSVFKAAEQAGTNDSFVIQVPEVQRNEKNRANTQIEESDRVRGAPPQSAIARGKQ